jgi:hypothetical protein
MFLSNSRASLAVCAAILMLSACSQSNTVPASTSNALPPQSTSAESPTSSQAVDDSKKGDSTSILKQDTKNVVIGSTVDPSNGDKGPHSISIVKANITPLKKGQLLVCNFEDSSGNAGNGTTIELLNPTTGSNPTTFTQNSLIKGCSGVAVSSQSDSVYAAGLNSGVLTGFNAKGVEQTTFGSPLQAPFDDTDIANKGLYAAEYMMTSDAKTGAIVSAGVNSYASGFYLQVASGFAVNSGSGLSALGPTGLSYYPKKNVLYIADGVTNTVVKFTNPNDLLTKNEIVVKSGGTKFTCTHKKTTCGKLIKKGSPLNSPIAMCALPNGNMIVANGAAASGGGNELVELTPTGAVLDTVVLDTAASPEIFGLAASGTSDSNTVIYYTDMNDNSVHELEPPG